MLAARLAGAFSTLQVRAFLHHVGVKIVLPLRKACPVAQNLFWRTGGCHLSAERKSNAGGRFLVHVNYRRHDIFPAYPLDQKISRPLKKACISFGGLPLKNSGLAVMRVSTNRVLSLRVLHPACSMRLWIK